MIGFRGHRVAKHNREGVETLEATQVNIRVYR
jgi:hypothetical protein